MLRKASTDATRRSRPFHWPAASRHAGHDTPHHAPHDTPSHRHAKITTITVYQYRSGRAPEPQPRAPTLQDKVPADHECGPGAMSCGRTASRYRHSCELRVGATGVLMKIQCCINEMVSQSPLWPQTQRGYS